MRKQENITRVLHLVAGGEQGAVDRLTDLVYDDFHHLASSYLNREPDGHSLAPTALVNEAYLKLVDQDRTNWQNRSHFFAVGARIMRRILVDHARRRKQQKRGGGWVRLPLREELQLSTANEEDVLALHAALEKLEAVDPQRSRVVELRFFGGLTLEETARAMGISKRTVQNYWTFCRAWLRRELAT